MRQLGKCIFGKMKIRFNKKDVEIGSIIKLSFKDKLVNKLEEILVYLSREQ